MHFKFQSFQIRYARFGCFDIRCVNFASIFFHGRSKLKLQWDHKSWDIRYKRLTPRSDLYVIVVNIQLIQYNTGKAFFILKKITCIVLSQLKVMMHSCLFLEKKTSCFFKTKNRRIVDHPLFSKQQICNYAENRKQLPNKKLTYIKIKTLL